MRACLATFLWCALSAVVLGACSSGSGSPASSQGGSTCDAVCQKAVSLNCINYTAQQCLSECNAEYSGNACATYGLGITSCALDNFGCDVVTGQLDATALLQACGNVSGAYLGCTACQADASDSACEACEKSSCCAERKAFYQNQDVPKYSACVSACNDTTCAQGCLDQYPTVVQLTEAELNCTNSKCASACSSP